MTDVPARTGLHFDTSPDHVRGLIHVAVASPSILRLHLFGSRVTGVRRTKDHPAPSPDLDVAFEVDPVEAARRGETPYTVSFFGKDRLRAAMEAASGLTVDLQYMSDEMAHVTAFVAAGGLLIYDKVRPEVQASWMD